MLMVWMRRSKLRQTRFHKHPDCRQLRKGPSRGTTNPLVQVPIDEADARPCRTCYPDAPKIIVFKRYCPICDSKWPCEHNGGVRVIRRHGEPQWVWPDSNQMPYFRKHM